jgi:hypothetical protein
MISSLLILSLPLAANRRAPTPFGLSPPFTPNSGIHREVLQVNLVFPGLANAPEDWRARICWRGERVVTIQSEVVHR